MKSAFYRVFTPGLIIIAAAITSALVAGFSTLRTSHDVVERYVSVWEEEIARNLLLKGDAGLFDRIKQQILDVASDVESTGEDAKIKQATGGCFAEQVVSVTLYGTPAGELHVCRSPRKLLFRSLTSPIFAFGLSAGLLLAAFVIRRASREAAARALNELAVRVAHDIRSPLMALKIAAGQAKQVATTGNTSALLEVEGLIEKATSRISNVADELLARSRSKGASRGVPIPAQTSGGTKLLVSSIQELIEEKRLLTSGDVVFEFRGPQTPNGLAHTQSTPELERVVSNLLQNAVEATGCESRGIKTRNVTIDANETQSGLSITIRDNGIGIPDDVLPRIGESGFSYGKSSGNGIGFSSARAWARSLGGEIDIRSLVGTGTEVRLTIPR